MLHLAYKILLLIYKIILLDVLLPGDLAKTFIHVYLGMERNVPLPRPLSLILCASLTMSICIFSCYFFFACRNPVVLVSVAKIQFNHKFSAEQKSLVSVSYTHLDVYKRQILLAV